MIRVEQRASTVLFKYLVSNCKGYNFLLPANVCPVVPLTFLKAGVEFSFVDIDKDTHSGSFEDYLLALNQMQGGKGVLFVNAYGKKYDTASFYVKVKQQFPDSVIIEDNCLCIPETSRTVPEQNVDLELYSTGKSKYAQLPIGGGYGFTIDDCGYDDYQEEFYRDDDVKQHELLRYCRLNHTPFSYKDNHWLAFQRTTMEGISDQDYLAMVTAQTVKSLNHKAALNSIYDSFIPDSIKMDRSLNNWRYMLNLPSNQMQQDILAELDKNGLFASTHYASAAYLFKQQNCINAEKEYQVILNLFNELKYSEEMATKTAIIIKEIYDRYDKQGKV